MKQNFLFALAVCVGLAGLAHGGSATNAGPGTLHLVSQNNLLGPATNIVGTMKLDYNDKGNGIQQKFDLSATGLTPLTAYTLLAALGADPIPQPVAFVSTDKKGKLKVSYLDLPNGGGSGPATNKAMPVLLKPLNNVRGAGLADPLGTTVAFGWFDGAALYAYQVKRNLTRVDPFGTAAGSFTLKGTTGGANFTLKADGLLHTNVYRLALNTNILNSATSDLKGRMQMLGWPAGAPASVDVWQLQVLDVNSNAVLTTTLP